MEHQAEAVGTASTRLGPRPLPLHLAIATMTWLSSRGTWPLWSSASPLWRPELRPQMQALDAALEGVERKAFTAALESETRARFDRLAAGIESYRRHPFRRSLAGVARPVAGRHHASARLSRRTDGRASGAGGAVAHQSGPHSRPHGRPQPAAGARRRRHAAAARRLGCARRSGAGLHAHRLHRGAPGAGPGSGPRRGRRTRWSCSATAWAGC